MAVSKTTIGKPLDFLTAVSEIHELAKEKGWWPQYSMRKGPKRQRAIEVTIPEKLMLIVSEASEALEDYRNANFLQLDFEVSGKPIGFASELADVVIRCFDLAGALGIDLQDAIIQKHKYNKTRPFRHGGKKV